MFEERPFDSGPHHAFRQGLSAAGVIEGQSAAMEYRWAEGQRDRLADLIGFSETQGRCDRRPRCRGGPGGEDRNDDNPHRLRIGDDPVRVGLVASFNRPEGNLTGVTTLTVEVGPKRLELMHEVLPMATNVALLVNPNNPNAESLSSNLQAIARTMGIQLDILRASQERDIDSAFTTLVQRRAGALVIGSDAFFNSQSERLAELALRHAVPAIFQDRPFAAAGGLMSYGGSIIHELRQVGVYVARVLRGERPIDLPVLQATKVQLIINLKTAKALGIDIPRTVLARADEVIE
jgi:putative tryptophan/tyrosine transport system substrate-binding protein